MTVPRLTLPGTLLRLEGLAVLAGSIFLYARYGRGWLFFAILFLAPDVAFLAYLAGPRVGAAVYNLLHTYAGPVLLGFVALATGSTILLSIELIWIAHIGFDRLLGYGLKTEGGFKDTHLQRV
jgi:hypothetical protein